MGEVLKLMPCGDCSSFEINSVLSKLEVVLNNIVVNTRALSDASPHIKGSFEYYLKSSNGIEAPKFLNSRDGACYDFHIFVKSPKVHSSDMEDCLDVYTGIYSSVSNKRKFVDDENLNEKFSKEYIGNLDSMIKRCIVSAVNVVAPDLGKRFSFKSYSVVPGYFDFLKYYSQELESEDLAVLKNIAKSIDSFTPDGFPIAIVSEDSGYTSNLLSDFLENIRPDRNVKSFKYYSVDSSDVSTPEYYDLRHLKDHNDLWKVSNKFRHVVIVTNVHNHDVFKVPGGKFGKFPNCSGNSFSDNAAMLFDFKNGKVHDISLPAKESYKEVVINYEQLVLNL
ncbi:hypothetical protein K9L97_05230 [Candidatus Woesearchaeota archaeon]|nr:hypothetical protein [Candidatus Woesearchaeota archaeon]